jgi:hypothetical protein
MDRFEFDAASYRKLGFDFEYWFGDFCDGYYQNIEWETKFNYKGFLSLELSGNNVIGKLPQGDFKENVYQLKIDLFATPDLGIMNYIQFDDESNDIGLSSSFRWRISPGNIIYIVYNHNWLYVPGTDENFFSRERRMIAKLQFNYRL